MMLTSNIIHDEIAETYGFNIRRSTTEYLKYNLLERFVKSSFDVLDIGCANGLYSLPCGRLSRSVTGIDINRKFLDIFEKKKQELQIKNVSAIEQDARGLDNVLRKKFDLVFSYSTLLLVPDCKEVIKSLSNLTKRRGVLILDITGKYNLSQRYWKKWYAKQGHYTLNAFSFSEIITFLKNMGFEIIESHGLGFCDQWKYLPLLKNLANKLQIIDKIFHYKIGKDLDYKISNLPILKFFANRWLIVTKKI